MKPTSELELIRQGTSLLTRVLVKYGIMERQPVDIGRGSRLNASQIHMIEAVGKRYGRTVTSLSGYFMITTGAVSQIVSKLCAGGFVAKTRKKGNNKEVVLSLTAKGWRAFDYHEKTTELAERYFLRLRHKYTGGEIRSFLAILGDIDAFFGEFIIHGQERGLTRGSDRRPVTR